MIGEITASTVQQGGDVTQLDPEVRPMNRSIQPRPALAGERAAAAERPEHQAQPLLHAVGVHRWSAT